MVKTVIPEEARPKLKQVGKIDLDNLNKKTAPKVVEPAAKVIEQTPKAEPVVEKVVERKETPQPQKGNAEACGGRGKETGIDSSTCSCSSFGREERA